MYFPIHKLRVPPKNIRRAIVALSCAVVGFATFGIAGLFKASSVEYYALMASLVLLPLSMTLAVPYIMLAVFVLLSPIGLYIFMDSPTFPMIYEWWFWAFAFVAIAAGIWILAIAEKKYPKRDL